MMRTSTTGGVARGDERGPRRRAVPAVGEEVEGKEVQQTGRSDAADPDDAGKPATMDGCAAVFLGEL